MATISKSAIELINIQGTSDQLENLSSALMNTQKAIFTATDTQRMYLCEVGKDAVMLGSDVQDVTFDSDTTILTIKHVSGKTVSINLSVDNALTDLETKITEAYTEAIDNAKTALILYADTKVSSVTGNIVSYPAKENISEDKTTPEVNLFAHYDSNENKIWFYKGTEQLSEPTEDNTVFSIDTTDFIYKGMIDNVSFDEDSKKLTIDFNTSAGKEDIEVDLSKLVDTYNAGDGLSKANNTFSINTTWLRKNAVTSLGGLMGKLILGTSSTDPFYYGISQSAEEDVELPFPTLRLFGIKSTSTQDDLDGTINGAVNPVNLLVNLAYLMQNHPDLVSQLALKGIDMSYSNDEGAIIDAHPKWYTLSE